jgi:hypothetical protein
MEQLIGLACDMRDVEYFHSEDPVEAARFVVSHAVSGSGRPCLTSTASLPSPDAPPGN